MSLDIRSQMAVNLIVNSKLDPAESFHQLALICAAWGMNSDQSLPLAQELRERLGISEEKGAAILYGEIAKMDGPKTGLN